MAKRASSFSAFLHRYVSFMFSEQKHAASSVKRVTATKKKSQKHAKKKKHGRKHASRSRAASPTATIERPTAGRLMSVPKEEKNRTRMETPATDEHLVDTPPKPDQKSTEAEQEILEEEGWMQRAKQKDVVSLHPKMSWGDALHTYMPTFFPRKNAPIEAPVVELATAEKPVVNTDSKKMLLLEEEEKAVTSPDAATLVETIEEKPTKKGKAKKTEVPVAKTEPEPVKPEPVKKEEPAVPEIATKVSTKARGSIGPATKAEPKPEPKKDDVPYKAKPRSQIKAAGFRAFIASLGHIGLGRERMLFTQNLAMMLGAGLPLMDSLKTLKMETRSRGMRRVIDNIYASVENGQPLWKAMNEQSFFSPHALALVRIGEEAGNLAENMEYLALQEDKDHQLKQKVKMAMIYPMIVMVLMFGIVMGLGLFVLPNLIGVLFSLDVELPFITRMVILFTDLMTKHGTTAIPAFIGGFILIFLLSKFTKLRIVTQWFLFRVPGVGRLAREATIARFGVIMGGLLRAGVPVVESLQSLVEVTPIMRYRNFYQQLLEHVIVGDSFAKSFQQIKRSQKVLPPSVQQLVTTGEQSGALSEVMLKIADIYDKKASETAQKLPVILEPMLLLIIGSLVGTIALAIIMPIYGIVGNVGR